MNCKRSNNKVGPYTLFMPEKQCIIDYTCMRVCIVQICVEYIFGTYLAFIAYGYSIMHGERRSNHKSIYT